MSTLRKLAREVARNQMKRKGMSKICQDKYKIGSFFSRNWKEYVKWN